MLTMEQRAARREAKRIARLPSIARAVKYDGVFVVELDGCVIQSVELEAFNATLLKLGYKPVRLTKNMLNPDSNTFAIDFDTPSYCDPGCESYHTM
jgi:hypothetical protein